MLAETTPLELPPMLARNGRPTERLSTELTLAPASGSPSFLFAAFAALLHRYTGQPDLVAGLMSAGDETPRALRVALADDLTFAELLERVEEAISDDHRSDAVPELRAVLGVDCD